MRTLICQQPGTLEYGQSAIPTPAPGEVLLSIKRIGVCGTDLHAFEGTQPYFSYPRILGHELAATIADANGAEGFGHGDEVTFIPYFSCGNCIACRSGKPNCCSSIQVCGVHTDGGMREYLAVPANALLHSQGLGVDELALVEPLAIGAHSIGRAVVMPGEFVLVVGAGPIGLGIIEFARIAGAEVVVMDTNSSRLNFCRQTLSVPYAINPADANAGEQLTEITGGDMPTVVIDATGNLSAINNSFQYLAHGGRYVLVGLQKRNISFSHPEFHKREATLMSSRNATRRDFEQVITSMKAGLVKPAAYITHRVAFDEVKTAFPGWLQPGTGLIKAMISMND